MMSMCASRRDVLVKISVTFKRPWKLSDSRVDDTVSAEEIGQAFGTVLCPRSEIHCVNPFTADPVNPVKSTDVNWLHFANQF